jgi:antitoxin HicB
MKYHFKVHKEGKGYWAECLELEGCQTQADSMKALTKNMQEALELYLSEPDDSKVIFPNPLSKKPKNSVAVAVSPDLAFAVQVRNLRLRHGYTQKEICEKLELDNLYSYQRLEKPNCNPRLATLTMLKRVYGDEFKLDSLVDID